MHIRHLAVVGAAVLVPLASAFPPAAAAEPVRCAVTEVAGLDQFGRPTDEAGEVTAVVASLTGDLPIDAGSTIGEAVSSAMDATDPVWTTMRSTREGVDATVSPVTGPLPADLDQLVEDALGCGKAVAATIETSAGGEPGSGGSEPTDAPPVAGSAAAQCEVTSVLPVDATGTVTANASAVEGAVVAVTGPLPVGVADTIAGVVQTATGTAGPVAVTVVETVDTVEVTVTGTAGPLPADLSTTLAGALGCKDTATPADPTDPGDSTDPSDPDGSLPSDLAEEPTSGDTSVAGTQIHSSGGLLPRTGGPIGLSIVAGSALLGIGGLARVLRRLLAARQDLRHGI